jgi:phage portal protein BeeE
MNFIRKIFGSATKEKSDEVVMQGGGELPNRPIYVIRPLGGADIPLPSENNADPMDLFLSLPEVFFPINFIAKRIAGAHFEVRKYSDDSIVWCSSRSYKSQKINRILTQPNCVQKWRELVYMHHVYKLATGNAYLRAAMASNLGKDRKWKWCDNYWSLPPKDVDVVELREGVNLPLFGIGKIEELVAGYRLSGKDSTFQMIPVDEVWHDRDGVANLTSGGGNFLKSASRLSSVKDPINNLIKVYESRNVIYSRSGALGILVNKKHDDTGTVALTDAEKKQVNDAYVSNYGIGSGKSPIAVTDADLSFLRTALSIKDLEPFEETLYDAIEIAGVYGIPAVLVPRKDQSTFSNQATAEKAVYTSTIIPMAKEFCEGLTAFLGIEEEGLYIDCNFEDVDCLQQGLKESEEVKKLVNDRCLMQFNNGLISINDWRSQIHESALEDEVFSKTKFEMTDQEIEFINRILNNQKASTGEEQHEGENKEPAVRDEGE